MRTLLFAAVLGLLTVPAAALDRSGTIIEARVYVEPGQSLEMLGDLAGELDVCTWGSSGSADYLVINTDAEQLARIRASGLRTEITWPDVREKFRYVTGVDPDDPDAGRDFGCFLTYWEMQDTLDYLVSRYPGLCEKTSIGMSHQGRPLWCLKISDNASQSEDEPACFFNGASHAREPLSTHCCVMFAEKILSEYGRDSLSTWLINNREIYIVPVMNPDGYVYNSDSGGASSNWRKNRRVIQAPSVGVDLNRNYGYKWGYDNRGSSGSPSSETYRGPYAFSEPATAAIRDFVNLNRFRTCQDLHTYGQYNMYPWGYSTTTPPEQPLLQEVVDTFRVNNGYSTSRTGQIGQVLYLANGVSVDWEYTDSAGKFVTYAFTCELGTDFWYGYREPSYVASECNKNIPNLYYLARVSGAYFEPVSVTLNDAQGNNNGRLDPGETANIWFTVRNRAVHPMDSAYQITAKLVSRHADVTVLDSVKPFPRCSRRSSTSNSASQFTLRASAQAAPGTRIPLRLETGFENDGRTYTQPVSFEITIGSDPIGIEETPATFAPVLRVSPNPARDNVRFALASGSQARLEVFAADGSRLLSTDVSERYTWNCARIPAGIYFCRVANSAGLSTARLNITH